MKNGGTQTTWIDSLQAAFAGIQVRRLLQINFNNDIDDDAKNNVNYNSNKCNIDNYSNGL